MTPGLLNGTTAAHSVDWFVHEENTDIAQPAVKIRVSTVAAATTKLIISLHHTLASTEGPHGGSWISCHSNNRVEKLRVAATEPGGGCVLDVFEFGSVLRALAGSGSGTEAVAAAAAGCAPPGSGCLWWQTPDTGSTASPPSSRHKLCPSSALQTWSSSVSASGPTNSGGWPHAGWT